MTILSRIRSRVGLLVGIIFLALLSFVLTDMFNGRGRGGLFGGGPGNNDVGEINGKSISVAEFSKRVEEMSKDRDISEQQRTQIQDAVWQQMIDENVFEPEYKKLGISVTDDELAEQMYGDHPSPYMNQFFQNPQTGQIAEKFAGPDGGLSGAAIRNFVTKEMDAKTEEQWALIEVELRKVLLKEKYNNLMRKGFYVTTAQAKREYADENTRYNFKYIVKKYAEVPDSTVKVTDEEMMAYYNDNKYKFKQRDDNRSMEYVAFDILPSADDIAAQRTKMEDIAKDFKAKKGAEDSTFVASKTESGMYEKKSLHAGQFPVGADSAFLKAAPGEVLGPFMQDQNMIAVYKVVKQTFSADSAKVRHILVAYAGGERADPTITRTKEKAKLRADSIQRVVKSGKVKMETIVAKLTDDPGSKSGNDGDYGWFTEESGFVQEFKDAGFKNPVGATIVVETSFGYHVIQVLDRTKESPKVQVEVIEKRVQPSENTNRMVYNKAAEFAGKNNTSELFNKAAQKDGMNILKADNVTDGSRYIAGIENPREISRWMYEEDTKAGAVSQPFPNGERYLVCNLTKIVEKGTKPFEEVREICELEARKIKKGKMFSDELSKKKGNSLDAWSANVAIPVQQGANVTFAQPYVQGAGYEGPVVGTMANMKAGQLSGTIIGTMGVYVVMVETIVPPDQPLTDVAGQKTKLITGLASRVDATAAEILKEEANIVDERAKHF